MTDIERPAYGGYFQAALSGRPQNSVVPPDLAGHAATFALYVGWASNALGMVQRTSTHCLSFQGGRGADVFADEVGHLGGLGAPIPGSRVLCEVVNLFKLSPLPATPLDTNQAELIGSRVATRLFESRVHHFRRSALALPWRC